MLPKTILISGSSSVGKTAVCKWILKHLLLSNIKPIVCKIDCLSSSDKDIYKELNIPVITAISNDICPDHFLVSNLPELWNFTQTKKADYLIIETAGLCNRCSPATKNMIAGCVIDATSSIKTASRLGPMVYEADFICISKIDMVSQAEREILEYKIKEVNANAKIFFIDGLVGYGSEFLTNYLINCVLDMKDEDTLRHSMPSGICSYCIGEHRVGSKYQQGVITKIDFKDVDV